MATKNPKQIIRIEHTQTLEYDGEPERAPWSENLEVSVRIFSEAVTSGWLKRTFCETGGRAGPTDFMVMITIGLHAHLLRGDELRDLQARGIATTHDQGRLIASITDTGLADELGMARKTIRESTTRLKQKRQIDIWELPANHEGGRFGPTKLYVLSPEAQRYFSKSVNAVASDDRGTSGSTVGPNRGTSGTTVHAHRGTSSSTDRGTSVLDSGNSSTTNIKDSDDEDDILSQKVFAHLETRNRRPYVPSDKDLATLNKLLAAGYSPREILAAVDEAFSRAPAKKHRVAHCAAICRENPPQSGNSKSVVRNAVARSPEEVRPSVGEQSGTRPSEVRMEPARKGGAVAQPPQLPEWADLQLAVNALQRADKPCTEGHLARLEHLARDAQPAAERANETGVRWVLEAVKESLTADDPVRYAAKVLRGWMAHGKHCDLRPASGNGHKPPKTKSTKWAERICH